VEKKQLPAWQVLFQDMSLAREVGHLQQAAFFFASPDHIELLYANWVLNAVPTV